MINNLVILIVYLNVLTFKTLFAIGDNIFNCPAGFSGQNCDGKRIFRILELIISLL